MLMQPWNPHADQAPEVPYMNRRPLRPELSASASESAASSRLRWSQALSGCRSPRLPAPAGVSPLPFRSQERGYDLTRMRRAMRPPARLPGDR
jgi:hypothetical protein